MDGSVISLTPIHSDMHMSRAGVDTATPSRCNSPQCGSCKFQQACVLHNGPDESHAMRLRVRKGESLFRAGDGFRMLYVVHSGFFKTMSVTEDGRDQVTGFHMGGDVLGMDGIETDHHNLTATALEDSNVCAIAFSSLESMCADNRLIQHQLFRLMSKEIVRSHDVAVLLGSMRAEERVAAFLVDLSYRLKARGYSGAEFHLRMTREEIGSYLGLKLETVSRAFSKFQEYGLFEVHNKHIRALDTEGLAATLEEDGMQKLCNRSMGLAERTHLN